MLLLSIIIITGVLRVLPSTRVIRGTLIAASTTLGWH